MITPQFKKNKKQTTSLTTTMIAPYLYGFFALLLQWVTLPLFLFVSIFAKLYTLIFHKRQSFVPKPNEKIAIVITGASSGLGKAIAFEYARSYGHTNRVCIGLIGTNEERLKQVAQELKERYGIKPEDIQYQPIDVRNEKEMKDFIESFEERYDGINVLIANAAVTEFTLKKKETDASMGQLYKQVSEINFGGVLNTVLPVVNKLIESPDGRYRGDQQISICLVSSLVSQTPMISMYGIAKRAVVDYGRHLRWVLSKNPYVNVSVTLPGWIDTDMATAYPGSKPLMIDASSAAKQVIKGIENGYGFNPFPITAYLISSPIELLPFSLFEPIFHLVPQKHGSRIE